MSKMLYTFYENTILTVTRGNHNGVPVNAKPVYYITLIEEIGIGNIKNNRIYFTLDLQDAYTRNSKKYQPNIVPTPFFKPFFYSKSEPFYHLQTRYPLKAVGPSNAFIRDNVDYAYLDNALWDLLQDAENRERLREAIVRHFFNETTEDTETLMAAESSNTYGQEEATDRQLWALKRHTGIDYRGRGLTKAEASEMIAQAKKEAEEKGISISSNEATTRQLNYLKRTTGIDYSDKGLTKAEATRMIRDLKEAEEESSLEPHDEVEATTRQLNCLKRATGKDYNGQGLTKRQASRMIQEIIDGEKEKKVAEPAFTPGSLEDILSKCKTREEQLEAARKYFGENK